MNVVCSDSFLMIITKQSCCFQFMSFFSKCTPKTTRRLPNFEGKFQKIDLRIHNTLLFSIKYLCLTTIITLICKLSLKFGRLRVDFPKN